MGSGKTSWAIQEMIANPDESYIYCTPFLDEVRRIKEQCSGKRKFYDPQRIDGRKIEGFNHLLESGKDIVLTHSTFSNANQESLENLAHGNYCLILDEVLDILVNFNDVANVIQRNGWFHVVINYYYETGKRKQKAIATGLPVKNNKRKAEIRCRELVNEWEKKLSLTNSEVLFSDFLREWLEHHRSRIADSTYQEYKKNIHRIICPYFAEKKITLFDLKPQHIQDFYSNRMSEYHTGAKTIHRYHANIHKALAYAVKMGRITSNPADMVELPKAQEHQADFYTVDELKAVIDKAKGTQIETVVMLAAWFGLRRGEIIGLRWSSINFDAKVLSITGTVKDKGESGSKIKNMYYAPTAKTKSSLRSFPLNDEMVAYLKNLKAQQDRRRAMKGYNNSWSDFVCVRNNGDLIPLEYVSRAFPKLCEDCGLRKLKLHELRHTNISLLLSQGASMRELQEWAGHANYSMTANVYAHIQAESKSRLTDSISSLLA